MGNLRRVLLPSKQKELELDERAFKKSIPALKVRQWLEDWDAINWQPKERRGEPRHWFYQFSMSATQLRALCGIYPRTTERRSRASEDLGIQRRHELDRSQEISRFVKYGYPWSNLSEAKRQSGEFRDLRQPGWLPTAIVVNVLTAGDERRGAKVAPQDLIEINDGQNGRAELQLPQLTSDWRPHGIPPIEVIDGQHRLWAFGDQPLGGDFELPVVAFFGLDLSWQAYLFYTINIKPKKINASLAFDLYPLLRTEEWLNKFEGHIIYRETRAQELVDLLWSHTESPWHNRINMLGEPGQKGFMVTQASWVRSLLVSFVKSWQGRRVSIGGLFGTTVGVHKTVLKWTRPEQAAFLIVFGQEIREAIFNSGEPWMLALREQEELPPELEDNDAAFVGRNNLLNSDQGVRALLQVANDLCYLKSDALGLDHWGGLQYDDSTDLEEISISVSNLRDQLEICTFLKDLSQGLASYDWRASSAPGLNEEERLRKAAFRGSGGYKELRRDVLKHLATTAGTVASTAGKVIKRLGY